MGVSGGRGEVEWIGEGGMDPEGWKDRRWKQIKGEGGTGERERRKKSGSRGWTRKDGKGIERDEIRKGEGRRRIEG